MKKKQFRDEVLDNQENLLSSSHDTVRILQEIADKLSSIQDKMVLLVEGLAQLEDKAYRLVELGDRGGRRTTR